MKKIISKSLAVAAAFVLFGCGENSSVSDANIEYDQYNVFTAVPPKVETKDYVVKVVDDAITQATVSASECNSSEELPNNPGMYILKNCVNKPSYIMITNGKIGDTTITQSFPLILNTAQSGKDDNFVVTPLTTLLVDANDSEVEKIASKFGIDKNDIFDDPKNVDEINMTKTLQKINAIYLKAESDGAVANKLKFVQTVREKLKDNITNGDFNVTKVAEDVQEVSKSNPGLFGLVFIDDLKDDENILDEIKEAQNPEKVTFLGLVFDDEIPEANIRVYRKDTNATLASAIAGSEGNFTIELNQNVVDEINNTNNDFIVIFEATKGNIKLQSSMTSKELRDLINKNKKITPFKNPDLVISNVTTVKTKVLDELGAKDSSSYESNLSYIQTYYNDKILKAAAALKYVVDNNDTTKVLNNTRANDTLEYVGKIISTNNNEINVTDTNVSDTNVKNKEVNITNNALLSRQLTTQTTSLTSTKENNGFEKAAEEAGHVFYRLLAYYKNGGNDNNDTFIREYTKIVVFAGKYEETTCRLEGNVTNEDWNCDEPVTTENANFVNGVFNAVKSNGTTVSYTLDENKTVTVQIDDTNRSYMLYEVVKKEESLDGNIVYTPELLVDNYDIVYMFQKIPEKDKTDYNKLKDLVEGKTKDEVNIELNRFVKDQIDNIDKYFKKK
jgi:hypothetical protein